MKITVFTSNQPRHLALINRLAGIADEVYAIQECNTVFPGQVADFFAKSPVMQRYFGHVMAAEQRVFGNIGFPASNVRQLPIKMGDLNMVPPALLRDALKADRIVVFGASYIKAPLIDILLERHAVNIHMGLSPMYRGSSCNFWALYDGNPHLVGATIHKLSKGLDSGPMLFHALPARGDIDPLDLGMMAVKAAHVSLCDVIEDGTLDRLLPTPQNKDLQIRYTRNRDFDDTVAAAFLDRNLDAAAIGRMLRDAQESPALLSPRYC
jgi:hypothetical protein